MLLRTTAGRALSRYAPAREAGFTSLRHTSAPDASAPRRVQPPSGQYYAASAPAQVIAETGIKEVHPRLHDKIIRSPPRAVALQHRQAGPVFAAAARFRQDLQQGIDITIAKINPCRQWMNGVRRIAHQRQAGLNILQRMTPGERERRRPPAASPVPAAPESDWRSPAGAAPWSCSAADGSAPGRRTRPARPSGRTAAGRRVGRWE